MIELRTQLNENQKCLNDITQEKGVSNWLKVYPISDQGYDFNKKQFGDCVRLRYGWRLMNIPSTCCESKMDIQHALSCEKGGFIIRRLNDLHEVTVNLMTEVCVYVCVYGVCVCVCVCVWLNITINVMPEIRSAMAC